MKKIDFENFKVIFENVRINGIRKFLSVFIRPLFSYNLKKAHRNSLEGLRERLKTLMLQIKMNALYVPNHSTGCSIIYYCILKALQKSSLSPFQSPDSSFDSHRHQIFLGQKIIKKYFIFDFLAQKY